jgi:hypothetical protein
MNGGEEVDPPGPQSPRRRTARRFGSRLMGGPNTSYVQPKCFRTVVTPSCSSFLSALVSGAWS